MSLLFMAPLKAEFDVIKTGFEQNGWTPHFVNLREIPIIYFEKPDVYLAVGGIGKVQFALQTYYFLQNLKNINAVLSIGCAGALSSQLQLADIVVATQIIEHDFKTKWNPQPPPAFPAPVQLTKLSLPANFQFYHGPIASGDEDIQSHAQAQKLFNATQALAVAWEGAGLARVARFCKLPWGEIRVISDLANENLSRDISLHFKSSLQNLAKFLIHAIETKALPAQGNPS